MLSSINRSALIITPNQKFFDNLAKQTGDETLKEEMPDKFDSSTVYLIPNDLFNEYEMKNYLESNYMGILICEIEGWVTSPQSWIKEVTFIQFENWFKINFQSMIYDTLNEEIEYDEFES